jgi:hypothetical protein
MIRFDFIFRKQLLLPRFVFRYFLNDPTIKTLEFLDPLPLESVDSMTLR